MFQFSFTIVSLKLRASYMRMSFIAYTSRDFCSNRMAPFEVAVVVVVVVPLSAVVAATIKAWQVKRAGKAEPPSKARVCFARRGRAVSTAPTNVDEQCMRIRQERGESSVGGKCNVLKQCKAIASNGFAPAATTMIHYALLLLLLL